MYASAMPFLYKGLKTAYVAAERTLYGRDRINSRIQSHKVCSSCFSAVEQPITPNMPGWQGEQKMNTVVLRGGDKCLPHFDQKVSEV